ncbi:hypothetical protein [Alteribacter populi]|uniref:hypothetical protein n=1 Tax=Alteribacter populi TaxID=2011011 RepID=UPI0012FFB000|nr:hypothetical protein [Alteribacter populi]
MQEFTIQKNGLGGKRSKCKKCIAETARKYYEANRVRIAERNAEYYEANRVRIAERNAEYYEANREYFAEYYQANRERISEYPKKYFQTERGREIKRLVDQRRRARKHNLPDTFTDTQAEEIRSHFGGCALTGEDCETHYDHVIPLASGHGGTIHGNMIPLRADLNISKGNRNVFEWFEANKERFKLEQSKFDAMVAYIAKLNDMSVEEYREYYDSCFADKLAIAE